MASKRLPFPGRLAIWTAWITTVGLFIVILIGFLDADTHSALGCGAMWPLCNGGLLPGPGEQALIEYGHRAITGIVGLLVAVLVIWVWRRARGRTEVKILGAFGLGFVIVEAGVGAAAVLSAEPPAILALHLGFSLLAFGGVVLLTGYLVQWHGEGRGLRTGLSLRQKPVPRKLQLWTWGTLIYLYVVIYLGAYVALTNAGWACSGWPLCNGAWIPSLHGAVPIIFAHRVGAVVMVAVTIRLYLLTVPIRGVRPDLYRAARAALGLVLAMAFSGAYIVWSSHSTTADIVHVSLLTVLFSVISYLSVQVLPVFGNPSENGESGHAGRGQLETTGN